MRTIKELLQVMLDNQDLFETGLCYWVSNLYFSDKIDAIERRLLINYIRDNKPSMFSSIDAFKNRNKDYYWTKENITPRIKWINKNLKLN
jgi:hypothetical protein